jgi:hypothetical protein
MPNTPEVLRCGRRASTAPLSTISTGRWGVGDTNFRVACGYAPRRRPDRSSSATATTPSAAPPPIGCADQRRLLDQARTIR